MQETVKTQLREFLAKAEEIAQRDRLHPECLSDEEILLYARNSLDLLPDTDRARIREHLERGACARCIELAELMRATETDYEVRKGEFLAAASTLRKRPATTPFGYAFEPV